MHVISKEIFKKLQTEGYLNYLKTELRHKIKVHTTKGNGFRKGCLDESAEFNSIIGLLALIISCQCDAQYKYRTHFQAFPHMFLETVN